MEVKIKRLNDLAKELYRGSESAAGWDLFAATGYDVEIAPHSTVLVGTGWAMAIPEGYFGGIYARSGLASKKGLRPANCTGVVDSDYRGEVMVALHNDTDEMAYVFEGERIAQLIVQPYLPVEFNYVDELDDTERGNGGFGSTGTK